MKIKPHKNKTVRKFSKKDLMKIKNINPKKAVAVILLVVLIGFGVYGTVIGIKGKIEDKKLQESITTTEAPVISLKGREKIFTENGIKISLTDRFEVYKDSAVDAGFKATGIEIYMFNETFEDYPEDKDLTEEEYLKGLAEINGEDPEKVKEDDGFYYLEYVYDSGEKIDAYVVTALKHDEGFLITNFITANADALAYKPHIMKWAKTVEYVGVEEQ